MHNVMPYSMYNVLDSNNTKDLEYTLFTKWAWLRANRGVLGRIAARQRTPVSAEYVRQVFWGQRSSDRIRLALLRAGAPVAKRQTKGGLANAA